MAVGLYSELARAHISRGTELYRRARAILPTAEGIRLCRRENTWVSPAAAPQKKVVRIQGLFQHQRELPATCSFMSRSTASRCRRSPAFSADNGLAFFGIRSRRTRESGRSLPGEISRQLHDDRSRPLAHVREREPRYLHEHVSILGAGGSIVDAERDDMQLARRIATLERSCQSSSPGNGLT